MVDEIISEILSRPGSEKVGMLLSHVGVVRGFSRKGDPVREIEVKAKRKVLEEILAKARNEPGIFAVEVRLFEGIKKVGEVLMVLVVAGDFRENVIRVLSWVLDEIKAQVTEKKEVLEN